MAFSDSSSLSSAPSSDNEEEPPKIAIKAKTLKLKGGKLTAASLDASPLSSPEPSPPPREPTPPHEYVLADNPDVAFLVMFRARFSEIFPKNVPNLGPQDIENGVVGSLPSEQIENLLCALLGLVLNRKKYVERGHHGRALEEAISTQKHQWPRSWGGSNPLPGTRTFTDMDPTERLSLLKTLVIWALCTSEAISNILKESYKQARHDDDLNQPLSVQPWGNDGRKRRYWLIEGQNDTGFRLYKENAPKLINRTWWSIAGNLDELKVVAEELKAENSQAGRRLAESMTAAIPRLEETLEKRKRKEYRQARRAAFTRPEPGYSLYEGRTRGKRMKYTFSDDDDSDANSMRRSTRQSNRSTPVEFAGPTVTASGRHVRSRFGRSYGDPMQTSSDAENSNQTEVGNHRSGRPRRSAANDFQRATRSGSGTDDEMSDDNDAPSSGEEWEGNDEDVEGKLDEDEDDGASDNASEDSLLEDPGSLIVVLKYRKNGHEVLKQEAEQNGLKDEKSQSIYETQSPPKFTEFNTSIPHRLQSSSPPRSEIAPSVSTPRISPGPAVISVPKQPILPPVHAYHPETESSPQKCQLPSLSQVMSPVHSLNATHVDRVSPPPSSSTVPPPPYSPRSGDVQQIGSPSRAQPNWSNPLQTSHMQNDKTIHLPSPAQPNGYSPQQSLTPAFATAAPQQSTYSNGYAPHIDLLHAKSDGPHQSQQQSNHHMAPTHAGTQQITSNNHQAPPTNWS